MGIAASTLRNNIYKLLDETLQSGKPLEINRKGRRLKIVPVVEGGRKLGRLARHPCLLCAPDEIVGNSRTDGGKNDLP